MDPDILDLLSDEELLRMIVGGSVVAFTILAVVYLVYITNLNLVLQYIKRKVVRLLIPPLSSTHFVVPIIAHTQVLLFLLCCLFKRARTIPYLSIYGPSITNGEIYRFFTSALAHTDIFHLYNNCRAMVIIGHVLEEALGIRVLLLFLLTNTLQGLLLFYWNPLLHTFGAAGVIFGFMGATVYCYYFHKSLIEDKWAQRAKDETLFFIARHALFGYLCGQQLDVFVSIVCFMFGFIACMAFVGGSTHSTRKQVVFAAHIVLIVAALLYSQTFVIHNLQADMQRVSHCISVAKDKSQPFHSDQSLQDSDYYTHRNLAHEVQQYILPLWQNCSHMVSMLNQRHQKMALLQSQRAELDAYATQINGSLTMWSTYVSLFSEPMESILQRAIAEKKNQFAKHIAQEAAISQLVLLQLGRNTSVNPITNFLSRVWLFAINALVGLVIFVKSFPQVPISITVQRWWSYVVLFVMARIVK